MMRTDGRPTIETNTNHPGKVRLTQILHFLFVSLVLTVLYFGSMTAVRAQVSTSSCVSTEEDQERWLDSSDIVMERVDYVKRTPTTSADLRGVEGFDQGAG